MDKGKGLTAAAVAIGVLCAASSARADAIINLMGPTSNAGTIDLSTADGQYGDLDLIDVAAVPEPPTTALLAS